MCRIVLLKGLVTRSTIKIHILRFISDNALQIGSETPKRQNCTIQKPKIKQPNRPYFYWGIHSLRANLAFTDTL